jgi:ABC-type sugar transport system ATPase subunit
LDAPLRLALRLELMRVLRGGTYTTLLVTHDQSEAMALGDRIAVMREGRIEQLGAPREVYDRPANVFVAGFVGAPAMALFAAESFGSLAPRDAATIGLRSDAVSIAGDGEREGSIAAVEDLGNEAYAYVETANGTFVTAVAGRVPAVGERVRLKIDAAKMHAFDAEGHRLALPARA